MINKTKNLSFLIAITVTASICQPVIFAQAHLDAGKAKNSPGQKVTNKQSPTNYQIRQIGPETIRITYGSPSPTGKNPTTSTQQRQSANFIDLDGDGKLSPSEKTKAINYIKAWYDRKMQFVNSLPQLSPGAPAPTDDPNQNTDKTEKANDKQ